MIKKKDLQRLQRMLKDFRWQVYDMDYLHRCLWHDMENYLEALIEEEFEETKQETFMEYCKRDIKAEEDIKNDEL